MNADGKNSSGTTTRSTIIQLRLHLVRHGETISNLENKVIGQSDSVCFFVFVFSSF
jgi:hypothetical protein